MFFIMKLLTKVHSVQMRGGIKIKDGEVRPEGCICELNFGYNAKTVVYTNSSSDIPKLSEIAGDGLKG